MGLLDLLSGKDWNIIAIMYENAGLLRVNGNRVKGANAVKARERAQKHSRTVLWAVFNQKRSLLDSGMGSGHELLPAKDIEAIQTRLMANRMVCHVLDVLEEGKRSSAAKPMHWDGN